mgnify:FL=1
MRIFYKFKYVVLLTFCMLSVVSYGQNSFVQEIEQAIKDMSSTTSFPDLKEKYEITKQKINAYKEERLGTNVLENLREENRLTKEVNEKYYKHYTGRVENYFKHSENWEKDKVSEFKSDLDYVYDSTIKTGYIENPKTFNDIRTAINEYEQLEKFIT